MRGQSGGSWGWQTQLDHSQVCSTCISRVYTCMHVKYTCIHVKYTCYKPGNGLVMLAILKNPYFDPSHNSVASEIFLSLLLKNDPCLKNGTLKLFLGNFWPRMMRIGHRQSFGVLGPFFHGAPLIFLINFFHFSVAIAT